MKAINYFLMFAFFCLCCVFQLRAQNTIVTDDDGYAGNSTAMLDVNSTSKGFLVPRLTTDQINLIVSPAVGLLVFNTDKNGFWYSTGEGWLQLTHETPAQLVGINDPLFKIVNANGDTVFAVYPEGVRINVGDGNTKGTGNKGGFAVGGFTTGKLGGKEFLRVTKDSVRVYIDTTTAKGTGNKGGFAVGGYTTGKGLIQDFLRVTHDSIRVYIDQDATKGTGNKGGFAVGGYTTGKLTPKQYLRVTTDSTRIYVSDTVSGFAIGSNKNLQSENFFDLTRQNYSIGHRSGDSITTGRYNIFFGYQSGMRTRTGWANAFIGYQAGFNNQDGSRNIFIGRQAGFSNNSGYENTFIGAMSGFFNTAGYRNIFIGTEAGHRNVDGKHNIFLGYGAGRENIQGQFNCFVGYESGKNNIGAFTDENGSFNAFYGYQSGYNNLSGGSNTFVGYQSGIGNRTGKHNTYIGRWTGENVQTGDYNVFIGTEAGRYNPINSSYRLAINASNTGGYVDPLIYGEFDNKIVQINGTLNVNDVLKLMPRLTAPGSPTKGMIYYNSISNKVQVWTGSGWENLN